MDVVNYILLVIGYSVESTRHMNLWDKKFHDYLNNKILHY